MRWTALVPAVACAASVAAPSMAMAVEAPTRAVVCLNTVLPTLPATPAITRPSAAGTIRSTTGTGVTLIAPQVLVPPLPMPGQNRALIAAGLLQSAAGPAATTPICY